MPEIPRRWLIWAVIALFVASFVFALATREPSLLERERDAAIAESERLMREKADAERAQRKSERQRVVQEARERVAQACADPALTSALSTLVVKRDDAAREVFVAPIAWAGLRYDLREGTARAISACWFNDARVRIRHRNTGRELASWSEVWGYDSSE